MAATPVIVSGAWLQSEYGGFSFSDGVAPTFTFAPGGLDATRPAAMVIFCQAAFNVPPTFLNAVYGGITCETAFVVINPTNPAYSGQGRVTLIMVALIPAGATLPDNNLNFSVDTGLGGQTGYKLLAGVVNGVTSITTLSTLQQNAVSTGPVTAVQLSVPAVLANTGDLLVASLRVDIDGAVSFSSSPAGYTADVTYSGSFGTAQHDYLQVINSSDAATLWGYSYSGPSSNPQTGFASCFVLKGAILVPNIVGESIPQGSDTLSAASGGGVIFSYGSITPVVVPGVPPGIIQTQDPVGGTEVSSSTAVNVTISAFAPPFDVDVTVIAQYANSPSLLAMVEQYPAYFDQQVNFAQFYNYIWNVMSAVGFGLDIWGRLVQQPRSLIIAGVPTALTDAQYLPCILARAFANIIQTTIPALNVLLQKLFPGTRAYVRDTGNMTMSYTFEFALTPLQLAIARSILPHPAGVQANIDILPSGLYLGFDGNALVAPFDIGVLYLGS